MRAAVDTRRLTVLVPPYAEPVAVRRRRTLPGVQALVDQRAVPLDEELFEPDRGSRIREPAAHRPTSSPPHRAVRGSYPNLPGGRLRVGVPSLAFGVCAYARLEATSGRPRAISASTSK